MDKINLVQMNSTAGNISVNLEKIKKAIAESENNSLIVFPEFALTGFNVGDLLYSEEFYENVSKAVWSLTKYMEAHKRSNKTVVVSYMNQSDEGGIGSAFNVISGDGVIASSSSDQFTSITHGGDTITLTTATTLNEIGLVGEPLESVTQLLVLSSWIYEPGSIEERIGIFESLSKKLNVQYSALINSVGGQDSLVFDGRSLLYRKDYGVCGMLASFQEDSFSFDRNTVHKFKIDRQIDSMEHELELYNASVLGLRDYVNKNNMTSVLVGVSGGIDSALTVAIASDAIGGENVYGVSMPSKYSSDHSIEDAKKLMENVGGHFREVNIQEMVDSFQDVLQLEDIAEENLQSRIRGVTLMGISNKENRLVLAPGNKSEIAVGYSTLYGDSVGGWSPISDIYKTDVYAIAKWLELEGDSLIPQNSIDKVPSAELRPNQTDQDSLPDYDLLDEFLKDHLEEGMEREALTIKYGEELTADLLKKITRAEWKRRQYPIGPKLSTMTFNIDRNIPITR